MSANHENAALEAEKVQGAETAAAGAAGDQEGEEESLVLKFKKPYKFEGREYTEVDLSAMEDMTAADLCAVAKLSGPGYRHYADPGNDDPLCHPHGG